MPAAVVVTARDRAVTPDNQRALASALDAPVFEVDADHMAATHRSGAFPRVLLDALAHVRAAGASGAGDLARSSVA
jgi:predicted alpha/beta hydrolase family esterase